MTSLSTAIDNSLVMNTSEDTSATEAAAATAAEAAAAAIDIHIIIKIVLIYHLDFSQWIIARTLSNKSKQIVDKLEYNRDSFGRQSMFKIGLCTICDKQMSSDDIKWLRYCAEVNGNHRMIPHCKYWKCHMSAIYSMIKDYKNSGIRILREPFSDNIKCDVPRSDGSVTKGECKTNFVIWVDIKQEYFVYTYWVEKSDKMYKAVPLKHFTSNKPLILFE